MACFLVPATEAIVTAVAAKASKSNEAEKEMAHIDVETSHEPKPIPFSRKLRWLTYMLMGGAVLLAFEHVWHGEVVPFFPFLTAMGDSAATSEMLHEMSTVGVTMAAVITAVWVGMVVISSQITKRALKAQKESN